MSCVFADSFYFFAILSASDAGHAKAVAISHTLKGRIVTTDWVLTEVADGLARPPRRSVFAPFRQDILANPGIIVVRFSAEWNEAGIDLYAQRPDKEWSLTDCIRSW